eukprot:3768744-Alexandrium_andersonii.AAC.1
MRCCPSAVVHVAEPEKRQKVAECNCLQLSSACLRLRALLGALSHRLRAPRRAQSCTKPSKSCGKPHRAT